MCRKRRQRHLSGFQIESFLNTAHLGTYGLVKKHMKLVKHFTKLFKQAMRNKEVIRSFNLNGPK